jgi:hypothetical protein
MIPITQIDFLFISNEGRWRVRGRGRKRDRDKRINGVRDGALEKFENGAGWKMTIGKGHLSF